MPDDRPQRRGLPAQPGAGPAPPEAEAGPQRPGQEGQAQGRQEGPAAAARAAPAVAGDVQGGRRAHPPGRRRAREGEPQAPADERLGEGRRSRGRLVKAALALLLALAAPARAALSINATPNRTTVALDEQLVLTVSVQGDAMSLPDPELPSMPRFNVHNAGRSQAMTMMNGRVSNTAEYTYILVPRLVGNAVIPPISVRAGGETAQTEPIAVVIERPGQAAQQTPQAAAPAGAPARARRANGPAPVFVTAETDKKTVYANEQVVFSVKFHYSIPLLGNAEWTPPDTTGMLSEDLPPSPARTVAFEGRNYNVSEVKIALFPLTPGPKTVGAGTIRCQVQKGVDVDPFAGDFFRQFFSAGLTMAEPVSLQTKPLQLTVKPLPEAGKPVGFGGAVGRFRVKAELDKSTVKAGDAVNLTVTVEGNGNLKALGELPLPDIPQFRAYETVTSLNQSKDEQGVRGSKVYKTVLVPKVSGDLAVPPIPFSYFDPAAEKYVTAQTPPLKLDVTPGDPTQAPVGFSATPGAAPSGITAVSEDIRHVRARPGFDGAARAAAAVAGAGLLHAVPAATLAFAGLVAGWRAREDSDPARSRARRAAKAADERLGKSRATKALAESSALVGDALVGYLADKLSVPPSGLTARQAVDALRRRWPKMPEGHLEQVKRLWGEMERIRYAPTTVRDLDVANLREAVKELIVALEEAAS
ncbi:hypothetical protein EPO15_17205 [bacterium]|nr:MAG: hypothetical protein EPO15_17205 [bacterium]